MRTTVLALFAVVLLCACDDSAPERPTTMDGVPFCGFSFHWWDNDEPNNEARECFISGIKDGHAEILLADWNRSGMVATRLVGSPHAIQGVRAFLGPSAQEPEQRHSFVECGTNTPTRRADLDELRCTETATSSPRYQPGVENQFCGVSQVRSSLETVHRAARECLLDAFEDGGSAFMIETSLTVEGDPIGELIHVGDGAVSVYMEAHDQLGYEGRFRYRCDALAPHERGVFTTVGCSDPVAVD